MNLPHFFFGISQLATFHCLGALGAMGHENHGKPTGVSMGVPENGWLIMGHPKITWIIWGYPWVPPILGNHHFFKKRHLLTLNEFIEPHQTHQNLI
jgi:hypothetical protein